MTNIKHQPQCRMCVLMPRYQCHGINRSSRYIHIDTEIKLSDILHDKRVFATVFITMYTLRNPHNYGGFSLKETCRYLVKPTFLMNEIVLNRDFEFVSFTQCSFEYIPNIFHCRSQLNQYYKTKLHTPQPRPTSATSPQTNQ